LEAACKNILFVNHPQEALCQKQEQQEGIPPQAPECSIFAIPASSYTQASHLLQHLQQASYSAPALASVPTVFPEAMYPVL